MRLDGTCVGDSMFASTITGDFTTWLETHIDCNQNQNDELK